MFFQKLKNDKDFFEKMTQAKNVEGMYGIINRLPNPDIVLRKTGHGIGVLRSLTNHYQVGTCIESRNAGVTSRLFALLKENTPDKNFEFYNDIFKNLDIHKLIENILEAPLFGYAPIEIIWEKDGNYIIPAKLDAEPQEWFHFNSEGEFFFKHKSYTPNGLLINPDKSRKFLLPRNKPTHKNPYGQAVLSRCFWNVAFINGGMEFWVKFMERYGMPFMIGKYDRSMTTAEKTNLLKMMVRMVQDAVGVIPSDGSVEIIEAAGKSASADIYEKLIKMCENNIAKSILGQTLTTDVGTSGSYAAANTHNAVRGDIIASDTRLCENTINTLIRYINEINFSDKDYPKCTIYDEKDIDQSLAERDNKIYNTGVRFTKEYMMKAYGYEDNDIIMIEETASPELEEFSESNNSSLLTPNSTLTDDLTDMFSTEDIQKLIDPALKPVAELFNKSRDAEDCMERIAEIYPDMNTNELEEALSKVIFIAELLGRSENN